jgi:predicted NBD/HSP70 family sugar kinase
VAALIVWLWPLGRSEISRVVGDAVELVGTHLAAVCNLLAPRRVIVIGPTAQVGELVLEPIRTAIRRHIAPSTTVPEIVLGALGSKNTPLGAIALALDETDWLPAKRGVRVRREATVRSE